jgi:hypothetical protein
MHHGLFQTAPSMSMRKGDTSARSFRPQITFMQPFTYRLRWNKDPHSVNKAISKSSCCRKRCTPCLNDQKQHELPGVVTLCRPPPGGCTMLPVSFLGSGEDGVVYTKRHTNLAEGGPLLHLPYSTPWLCFFQISPYVSMCRIEVTTGDREMSAPLVKSPYNRRHVIVYPHQTPENILVYAFHAYPRTSCNGLVNTISCQGTTSNYCSMRIFKNWKEISSILVII